MNQCPVNQWSCQCCVIGAGVVGLAIARQLARAGFDVLLLEQESQIGTHTSSRNSEVIHAGLYYPRDSLKAFHCRHGRDALYRFCDNYGVAYSRCGKIVIAKDRQQRRQLEQIRDSAVNNGVDDLEQLDQRAIEQLEPELQGSAALLSPSTGIVDSHGYMLALQGDFERHGGVLSTNSRVVDIEVHSDKQQLQRASDQRYRLTILETVAPANDAPAKDAPAKDAPRTTVTCRYLINASGLFSAHLLQQAQAFPDAAIPTMRYAKGNYFQLNRKAPFSHLIYPLPEAGGLGVHLTLDLSGRARFGPDVEWLNHACISEPDYHVNKARADNMYAAIRNYWPALQDGDLSADYSGIRPKVASATADNDFMIQTDSDHKLPGWINLFGIESPGLTASLSLADEVCNIIRGQS